MAYRSDLEAAHETIARLEGETAAHRRPRRDWVMVVTPIALVIAASVVASGSWFLGLSLVGR